MARPSAVATSSGIVCRGACRATFWPSGTAERSDCGPEFERGDELPSRLRTMRPGAAFKFDRSDQLVGLTASFAEGLI
jgi:hypothetical protein